ncbi:MAG: NnrS family protein [Myxococcota bacterium]
MTTAGPGPAWAWRGHPLWLVGFRPFFLLAALSGTALPVLWMLVLAGAVPPPSGASPLAWHAHEMFYGFGFAVLGGFLLTATKNWVKVRGYHGRTLQALAAAWLLERVALWAGGAWARPVFVVAVSAFHVALLGLLAWTLLRHRASDSYRSDNPIFLVALPAFLAARWLLLTPSTFATGEAVTLALFRLVFLVMLERTLPPFMKAAFQVTLPPLSWLNAAIKGLGLALVAGPWWPAPVHVGLALALAALVAGRLVAWRGLRALARVEVGVMVVGAGCLAAQLVLEAQAAVAPRAWTGALAVHVFTFGVMGLIIPAMMTRIARGHTGRPVAFDAVDRAALGVMAVGLVARVVVPQLAPALYQPCLWLAGSAFALTFAVVGVRSAPLLWRPRVDGKEH